MMAAMSMLESSLKSEFTDEIQEAQSVEDMQGFLMNMFLLFGNIIMLIAGGISVAYPEFYKSGFSD